MGKGPHDGSQHVCFFPSDPPDLGKSFSSSFQYNFKIEVFLKTGETDSGMRLSAKKGRSICSRVPQIRLSGGS